MLLSERSQFADPQCLKKQYADKRFRPERSNVLIVFRIFFRSVSGGISSCSLSAFQSGALRTVIARAGLQPIQPWPHA